MPCSVNQKWIRIAAGSQFESYPHTHTLWWAGAVPSKEKSSSSWWHDNRLPITDPTKFYSGPNSIEVWEQLACLRHTGMLETVTVLTLPKR